MKNIFFVLLAAPFLLMAEGEVCHKCQVIREYNANHPENNYEYYDDYLKELKQKEEAKKEAKLSCDKCKGKDKKEVG